MTDGGALPTEYQYFSETNKGGSLAQADYCPYYTGYSNGLCTDSANTPVTNDRGQQYAQGSMCYETSVLQVWRAGRQTP